MPTVKLGDREVGAGQPVYVVAELSGNHGGDLGRAVAIVHAAAEAGADAVKLQTYRASSLTIRSDREPFRVGGGTLWDGRLLYDLYEEAATPWEWHEALAAAAAESGIAFFSTAFDLEGVELLESLEVPVHKIASFELTDIGLIERVAATGKPLILSTGMASLRDIDDAVHAARTAGAGDVVLLRCNSAYPAVPSEMDLASIPHMRATWGVPVGLSDHTMTPVAAVAAVALGACMIEKHVTLRRADGGPDAAFSLEPPELATTVQQVREASVAIGTVRYGPSVREVASAAYRRSLFVVEDIAAGEPYTDRNVRAIRPADGLAPAMLPLVLGRRATADAAAGTPLTWDLVGG